jgi:hypothetical protein
MTTIEARNSTETKRVKSTTSAKGDKLKKCGRSSSAQRTKSLRDGPLKRGQEPIERCPVSR